MTVVRRAPDLDRRVSSLPSPQQSSSFARPEYLYNGDSHMYNSDRPLGTSSRGLPCYGLTEPICNLTPHCIGGASVSFRRAQATRARVGRMLNRVYVGLGIPVPSSTAMTAASATRYQMNTVMLCLVTNRSNQAIDA
jgi:hypothetical protein